MAKTADVRARIELSTRETVKTILNMLDISESEAIRSFYRQIILHRGIPFELKIPNAETKKAIKNSIENKECEIFSNEEDLFDDLGI